MNLEQFALNFRYAFRPTKPFLTVRLAGAVIRSLVFRRPPLRYVDFAVDFRCNLRCEHCFATSLEDASRRTMAIEDYARVSSEAMKLGAVNFSFQGGEPLLVKDLGRIIAACKPHLNVISVTTNGTLITRERLRELKSWGVDILTISLDSARPDEHDRFRGVGGAFDKTMNGIHLALNAGFRVTLGTVVTHATLRGDGIRELMDFARGLKVILYLILPVPAGRWASHGEILLTADDLRHIDDLVAASPYIRTDFQANFGGHGCGAVKEILYLTPYGDVLACPFLHISLGSVFEESVHDIRARALRNHYFSTYRRQCLASTDQEFIEKYLSKTFSADHLPLDGKTVFAAADQRNG